MNAVMNLQALLERDIPDQTNDCQMFKEHSVLELFSRDVHFLSRILWSSEIKDLQEMGECLIDWVEYSRIEIRTCATN